MHPSSLEQEDRGLSTPSMDDGSLFATPSTSIRLSEVLNYRTNQHSVILQGPWYDLTQFHLEFLRTTRVLECLMEWMMMEVSEQALFDPHSDGSLLGPSVWHHDCFVNYPQIQGTAGSGIRGTKNPLEGHRSQWPSSMTLSRAGGKNNLQQGNHGLKNWPTGKRGSSSSRPCSRGPHHVLSRVLGDLKWGLSSSKVPCPLKANRNQRRLMWAYSTVNSLCMIFIYLCKCWCDLNSVFAL
jgi:hypothetical protein